MFPFFAMILCLTTGGFRIAPRAMTGPRQQDAAKPSSQEKQTPNSQQKQPSSATPPAAAPARSKKVITNDDLQSSSGFGSSPADFGEINDCDRSCFQYLQQSVRVDPAQNPHWRRDILRSIDLVRKDAEWQGILREVYDLHLKLCELGDEKRQELNTGADPHNVTSQEVGIEEKYDVRFKKLQDELRAVYARQSALRTGADNPVAYRFRIYQEGRVQNAACAQRTPSRYAQSDADDP